MKTLYMVAVTLLCFQNAIAHQGHPVVTYFRRLNEDGSFVDRRNTFEFNSVLNFQRYEESYDATSSATLKVTPSVAGNGGRVVVQWSGVVSPNAKDWVGLFCPHEDDIKSVLDYIYPSKVSTTWEQGHGEYTAFVYNMRSDCEFRYYLVATSATTLVARSNLLSFRGGPAAPLQGHLALTSNADEMRVMWTSGTADKPTVHYGQNRGQLTTTATGTSKTYKASDHCGPPANSTGFRDPGYIHDVLLSSLLPNTRYYYQFGSDKGMSNLYNFTTAIPAGEKTPFNFVVYGDMGINPYPQSWGTEMSMMDEYRKNDLRLIFHIGDVSYAFGQAYVWEQWHAVIEPYATLVPYMIGVGNHEQDHSTGGDKDPSKADGVGFHPSWGNYGDDSGGECGVPMYNRFHMPDNGNFLWWYSYDFGMVHFIMISTEHDFSPSSRQYDWLVNDLKSIDRTKTPWVILGGHRPMYESQVNEGDYKVARNMQRLLEDLLYYNKVDLAVYGHYHSYERTCKIYRDECQNDGIVHLTVGTAGYGLDERPWTKRDWSMERFIEYGYSRVSVLNTSSLHVEFIRNNDQTVLDNFYVNKQA